MERRLTFLAVLFCALTAIGQGFTVNDVAFLRQPPSSGVSGAIAWYEGNVGSFTNDQSGFGHTLTSNDSGQVLQTNQVNGLPAVLFPAGVPSSYNSNVTNAQPYQIFLVMSAIPNLGGGFPFEVVSPQQQFLLGFFSINAGLELTSTTIWPTNKYNYVTGIFNGSSSIIRQNGVQVVTTGNAGAGTLANQTLQQVTPFDIHIAEWIICTNLSPSQITNNENYLKNKYGL